MKKSFSAPPSLIATVVAGDSTDIPGISIPARTMLGRHAHSDERAIRDNWQPEVFLTGDYTSRRGDSLHISGRADFVKRDAGLIRIVELKSVALSPEDFSSLESLPKAFEIQAKIYAYLEVKSARPGIDVNPIVACINLADNGRREWLFDWQPSEVETWFETFLAISRDNLAEQLRQIRRRAHLAKAVRFPLENPRPNQLVIMETIEGVLSEGGDVIVEAPPGTGKTLATLVPSLKHSLAVGCQLFFATAKGGGRSPARKAATQIIRYIPDLKVVLLSSREEICNAADLAGVCANCPLHQSVEIADELVELPPEFHRGGLFDTESFVRMAKSTDQCAYRLSRLAAAEADLLIGDYNFLFDPQVQLEFFRGDEPLNWITLIDEAHNLPDRARENWSVQIRLDQLETRFELIKDDIWRFADSPSADALIEVFSSIIEFFAAHLEEAVPGTATLIELALNELISLSDEFSMAAGRLLAWAGNRIDEDARMALFQTSGELSQFAQISSKKSKRFLAYAEMEPPRIGINCLDASEEIAVVIKRVRGFVAFSGTIAPFELFQRQIGKTGRPLVELQTEDSRLLDGRLLVTHIPRIDTRYRRRLSTIRRVSRTLAQFSSINPGSTLAVFPSFEYLGLVEEEIGDRLPVRLVQRAGMSAGERLDIRRRLGLPGEKHLALVVAGGQFTEAEDFPGDACTGIVMVGPCLPPFEYWNEIRNAYWNDRGEDGQAIVYLIPAVRKVIQAAGRILRRESDRGVVLLMDDRYLREPIWSLLPRSWQEMLERRSTGWVEEVREFWIRGRKPDHDRNDN